MSHLHNYKRRNHPNKIESNRSVYWCKLDGTLMNISYKLEMTSRYRVTKDVWADKLKAEIIPHPGKIDLWSKVVYFQGLLQHHDQFRIPQYYEASCIGLREKTFSGIEFDTPQAVGTHYTR